MSFELNQNNILIFLNRNHYNPVLQKETGQVYIIFKKEGPDVLIFFVPSSQNNLLQIVAYLPYRLPENNIPAVARLLHLLNKELDMPGFGMDEQEKLMFYRSVIPCLDGKLDEKLLRTHIGTVQVACDSFMQAIGLVAAGTVNVEQFFKKDKQ